MKLHQRISNLALAFLTIFSAVPQFAINANAATEPNVVAPAHSKTLTPNGDGSYQLTLSVTGKSESTTTTTKANVVIVLDTSGSMNEAGAAYQENTTGNYGIDANGEYIQLYKLSGNRYRRIGDNETNIIDAYQHHGENNYSLYTGTRYKKISNSRLDVAKNAVKTLSQTLLSGNTTTIPDLVELSLISFNNLAKVEINKTSIYSEIESAIGDLGAGGGTNWEDALEKANAVNFGDSDTTYVIFVSDGNPTFRNTKDGDNNYGENTQHGIYPDFYYGSGNSDNNGKNYKFALEQAKAIVSSNKEFYTLGVFGNVSNMQSLTTASGAPASHYYAATDEAGISAAFSSIAQSITNTTSYTNIVITDQLTHLTSSAINGNLSNFKYTKNGATWTEAPSATYSIENKTVNWNLGSQVLENGVTYSISFTIWPSQNSLDLVADLNNGLKNYSDLSTSEKQQIMLNGNNYKLKTNTDYPTISFTQQQSINGGAPTIIGSGSATFENPDPIDLCSAKVDLRKIWEDGLDVAQRADFGDELKFDLLKDGAVYLSDVTLSAANNWLENANVAPGIMVSASSPAFDANNTVQYNGSSYTILESGHRYTLKEKSTNNHYETKINTYQPMAIDGVLKNTILENGAITGITDLAEISATNTLKGGLNIEKIVVDNNGNAIENVKDQFSAHVELKNPDGSPYAFEYRLFYGQNNPNFVAGSENRSNKIFGNGAADIALYAGDQIRFVNVATGTQFSVDENSTPFGYTKKDIRFESSYNSPSNYTTDDTISNNTGVIRGNTAHKAIITNQYHASELKITKEVVVKSGDAERARAKSFSFTINLNDGQTALPGEYTYQICKQTNCVDAPNQLRSGDIIQLKDGETAKIPNLPAGTICNISETSLAGFTTTAENANNLTLVEGQSALVKFINTYETSGKISLRAIKQLTGRNWRDDDEFSFELKQGDSVLQTVNLTKSDANGENAPITFNDILVSDHGEYSFIIHENYTNGKNGISPSEDITVNFSATDNGDGTLTFSTPSYSSNGTIINTYSAVLDAPLELQVTKILTGRDWLIRDRFSFNMYDSARNLYDTQIATKTNQTVSFKALSYNFNDLAGANSKTFVYFIEEAASALPGTIAQNTLKVTVTLQDDGNGKLSAITNYEQVANDSTTPGQTITNQYDATPASISLSALKTINDQSNSQKDGTFNFILEKCDENYANCHTVETKSLTTTNLQGSLDFSDLEFTTTGTFYYQIREEQGNTNGFSYDQTVRKVQISVTENYEEAKLYAETTIDDMVGTAASFVNNYAASATSLNIDFNKILDGMNAGVNPTTFTFTLYDENNTALDEQQIAGSGNAHFTLNYNKVGNYYYTLRENVDNAPGYNYDQSTYGIEVAVVDEAGQLVATPTFTKNGTNTDQISFHNHYATANAILQLTGKKQLTGRVLREGEFSFSVFLDGRQVAWGTNDQLGNIQFSDIHFNTPGYYQLIVHENQNSTLEHISFDQTRYALMVEVIDNGQGALVATLVTDASDSIIFRNSYHKPAPILTPAANPNTNDGLTASVLSLLGTLICLFGASLAIRRNLHIAKNTN